MGRFNRIELDDLVLAGARLTLRPWRRDDASAVLAAMRDPDMHRFLQVPLPYREEDARDFVGRSAFAARAEGAALECAVEVTATGTLIGAAALRLPRDGRADADVGYWVAAEHRGNRYGAEAVRVLSRWGFDAGIERIELECDVRNAASAGTALAAGFRYEGTLRDRLSEPGRDAALFARVAGDSGDPIPAQFPRLAEPRLSDGTVTLRTLDTGDMEEFAEQEQDPLTIATGFSGNVPPPAELARTCARAALDWLVGPLARFALVDEATGAFAGSVQLRLAGPPQVAGVGYAVHPAFRGRGYTARALQLLVPWAFDVAGFARLELGAKAWNVASQRAALRAGFEPDGVRAARLRNPDGSFSDEVRFALVNPAIRRD